MKYVIWVLIFIVVVVNHSTNESDKEVENSVEIVLENLLDKNSLYEYIQSGGATRFRGAIAVSYCENLSYIKKTEIVAHNGAKQLIFTCLGLDQHWPAVNKRARYFKYGMISQLGSIVLCGWRDNKTDNGVYYVNAGATGDCPDFDIKKYNDT